MGDIRNIVRKEKKGKRREILDRLECCQFSRYWLNNIHSLSLVVTRTTMMPFSSEI